MNPSQLPSQPPTQLQDLGPLSPAPEQPSNQSKSRKSRAVILLPIMLVFLLLGGGAAAYYGFVVMQSPERTWEQAMERSATGFEELLTLTTAEPMKGGKLDGAYKLSSPMAVDGTVEGSWYETTGKFTGSVGAVGMRVNAEIRMIPPAQSETPDIYMKLDGLGGITSLLGSEFASMSELLVDINGTWYVLDHTLLDQISSGTTGSAEMLGSEELSEVSQKVSSVMSERLFSTDESVAVFKVESYVGEEEFEGDPTYKYNVILQKEQLKAFVTELKDALKGTATAESMLQDSVEGTTFEDVIGFDEIIENIDDLDSEKLKAEVWVHTDQKMFRNIRIAADELAAGDLSVLDIGFDYEGGDELPFSLKLHNGSDSANADSVAIGLIFNKSSQAVTISLDIDMDSQLQKIVGNMKYTITPSNESVDVEVPEGAKSALELISLFTGVSPTNLEGAFDQGGLEYMYSDDLYNNDSDITPEEL